MKVYVQLDKKVKKRPQRPSQHTTPLQIIQPQWKHRRRRWKIHHMLKRAKFCIRLRTFPSATHTDAGLASIGPQPLILPDKDGGEKLQESKEQIRLSGAEDAPSCNTT